jgi:hypothetical protein
MHGNKEIISINMEYLIIINLIITIFLSYKIFKKKESSDEKIIEETKIEKNKIVEYINSHHIFKMPVFDVNDKEVEIIIKSLSNDIDSWDFRLSTFSSSETIYGSKKNTKGKDIEFNIDYMNEGNPSKIRVNLSKPISKKIDNKFNEAFYGLVFSKFQELWNEKVSKEIEMQDKFRSDIYDLMDQEEKRDDILEDLIG